MTEQVTDGLQAMFFDPGFKDRAYGVYADLRERAPVTSVALPNGRTIWFVAGYDEALAVLRDHARFANDPGNIYTQEQLDGMYAQMLAHLSPEQMERIKEVDTAISRHLLGVDPPDHTRLRKLVSRSFTPKYVEELRPRVQQIADDLLHGIEARMAAEGTRVFDVVDAYAFPLPLTVIAEMLGIPEEMRDRFRDWSNAAVEFNPAQMGDLEINQQLYAFVEYMRWLIAEKRERPGDDLVSLLVQVEEEGDRLSEEELLAMIFLLIVAGHETTVKLIGNGMLALFEHPEQFARLRADPSLVKNLVEEALRFSGPVEHSLPRYAREDVEIGGATIPRGSEVMVLLASADRDTEQFPDPDRFDLGREPGRHLAFGMGIHVCLGAPLARIEGQVAFASLLARFPDIRLAVPRRELTWRPGTLLRGLDALPVAV
jgi:cytochrome P450